MADSGKGVTTMAAQLLATSMPCMRQSPQQPCRMLRGRQIASRAVSQRCLRTPHAHVAYRSSRVVSAQALDDDDVLAEAVAEGEKQNKKMNGPHKGLCDVHNSVAETGVSSHILCL